MIDATPRHLLIWGTLNDKERTQVITKFYKETGSEFNIMDNAVRAYLEKNFSHKSKVKVITK
jgi:hypothetical protein